MNEVSCRVLDVFFGELRRKGIPAGMLFDGVDYSIQRLQNKQEHIDWSAFVRICKQAEKIWTEEELLAIGAAFPHAPFVRWTLQVARLLFTEKDFYRWLHTPSKFGPGRQFFSCLTPGFDELSDNLLRLSLEVHDGYERFPRSFLIICKGVLIEMSRVLGSRPAKVEEFETSRGGQFVVEIIPRNKLFRRVHHAFVRPFSILAAGRELKEANELLQERYEQLEDAHRVLDRQMTALKTAHTINNAVRGELDLIPALETIAAAIVEVGGFRGAKITVNTDIEGKRLEQTRSQGEMPDGVQPVVVPLIIGDRSIGSMHLWTANASTEEPKDLLQYVTPTVMMALDGALKFTALVDFRNTLEMKVIERTEELQRVSHTLAHTVEQLKESQSARSRLFANISHEFRTPLTLIEGPAKQLASGGYPVDVTEQAGMITRNSQRLLRLVNQLLDLSKIESGQMKLQARELDIVKVVQGTAAAFESLTKHKGIQFNVECADDPIIGWFDRDAVEKIVTNLLSNAFKFTGDAGEVRVHVGRNAIPSYSAEITVSDTGIGIPADQLDKVFDRFYQVDASQTREHEGTGIGLALTKELVELHKGEINVTSEVGTGTTFTVRLPLSKEHFRSDQIEEPREEPKPDVAAVVRPDWSTYEVEPQTSSLEVVDESLPLLLIVEDNADMRKYMRTYLDERHKVIEAVNGEEGIEKAIESIPDLIISDVMMPKMDGFQLCEKLKTDGRTSHIPIILLTAKATAEHKLEGLETGADDYVTKPFDAKELQVRVKNLIEQRRKLRERFRKDGTFKLKDIAITSADGRFLKRAMEVVETHLADRTFSVELFAQEMYLSRMQLHRKIKALTGHSPWDFVRMVRMERASQLLQRGAGTVAEVADQVGYDDPSHFAEHFRRQFGVTPSEYAHRQSNQLG